MLTRFQLLLTLGVGLLSEVVFTEAKEVAETPFTCHHPKYDVHIFSKDPLVIYISDFITLEESEHLQESTYVPFISPSPHLLTTILSKDLFSRSSVADESGTRGNRETRTSQSASVPHDAIVSCIQKRALSFQGFSTPSTHLEPLQLVQYATGQNYHLHTDWFTSSIQTTSSLGGNRQTSFFVYVKAENVTGGGTNFPMLDAPVDERWCRYVDCDEPWENGVTFRPRVGSAVFWQNLRGDGRGDEKTIHAGLPVVSGKKVGMNIWTRQWPLSEEFRGINDDL
jgi:prolyl 4-hydroxylase